FPSPLLLPFFPLFSFSSFSFPPSPPPSLPPSLPLPSPFFSPPFLSFSSPLFFPFPLFPSPPFLSLLFFFSFFSPLSL
ncbi:hypothetical protein ACXWR7_13350, partial [Streptococcus pyogenes]